MVVSPDGKHELHDLVNDSQEKDNVFSREKGITQRLLKRLGYFSCTKLPGEQFENVQEAYEWAHTSIE